MGLSCWSVSGERGPWPAAVICSELVLGHHSRPSLLVSPANVSSLKLTFYVHSVYSRLCAQTQTSGAEELAGAAEVEVLEEVLEVDKLIAALGFSSWVAFPFTYKKKALTLI